MSLAKILKQIPIQLLLVITLALIIGPKLSLYHVSLFYTISSNFIEILLFLLPVVVFSFILRAIVKIEQGSFLLLVIIFVGVTCSNCIALIFAYLCSKIILPTLGIAHATGFASQFASSVSVFFKLNLPQYIGVEKAMLLGMLLGIGANLLPKANASKIVITRLAIILSNLVSKFLSSIFIPLLPIYVFGFCLKLSFDHALIHLFYQYGQIFLFSLVIVLVYLVALYIIGAGGNFKLAISNIKMMLPAGLTAFSTMSSAATMPLTLSCAEKIAEDKNFVDLTIPSTANIHMLGDDLTIVITSMTLLSVFGMSWPDLSHFIPFAFAFSLAKLSCVGIPGASVLVILPVLQGYLGFTPEMISILTIIYTLQDPFGTAANVMGNGAFAVLLEKIFKRIKSVKLTNKTRESYDSTL